MALIELLKDSKAWDTRYNLPTFPYANNPWLYMAFAEKVLSDSITNPIVDDALFDYGLAVPAGARWPDGSGGKMSYDEWMGYAYLLPGFLPEFFGTWILGFIRFPWFIAYLQERSCRTCWLAPTWALMILFDALAYSQGDEEGRLRIWLMSESMRNVWSCRWAWGFWRKRMRVTGLGMPLNPSSCFAISMKEVPLMAESAPKEWI